MSPQHWQRLKIYAYNTTTPPGPSLLYNHKGFPVVVPLCGNIQSQFFPLLLLVTYLSWPAGYCILVFLPHPEEGKQPGVCLAAQSVYLVHQGSPEAVKKSLPWCLQHLLTSIFSELCALHRAVSHTSFLTPHCQAVFGSFLHTVVSLRCHGLVDKVVLVRRLDSVISKVFSNLVDSVILAEGLSWALQWIFGTSCVQHGTASASACRDHPWLHLQPCLLS